MTVTRCNQKRIYNSFETPFISGLLGQRRVGKSTLVEGYVEEHPERLWVQFNMDSMATREMAEKDLLRRMIEEEAEVKIGSSQKIWVVIDEAQKCPELFDQIKVLYDEYKDKAAIKFIVTGSGFLNLHRLSAETLAGRIELYVLYEFTLREAAAFQKSDTTSLPSVFDAISLENPEKSIENILSESMPYRKLLQNALHDEIVWGGLPELIEAKERDSKINYISQYLQTYLEKDVRDIETINDLPLYRKLIDVVASQTGSIRNDQKVLDALKCKRETLNKYRGFMEATFIYKEISPFVHSLIKRIRKAPKCYLLNNGLLSYSSGIFEYETLLKTGIIGHRFENWFLKELLVWLSKDPRRNEIYYWRTPAGAEVDFVVEKPPVVYPFEITFNAHIDKKKVSNLKRFMQSCPNARIGFYVYNGDFYFDKEYRILFIPAWVIG